MDCAGPSAGVGDDDLVTTLRRASQGINADIPRSVRRITRTELLDKLSVNWIDKVARPSCVRVRSADELGHYRDRRDRLCGW